MQPLSAVAHPTRRSRICAPLLALLFLPSLSLAATLFWDADGTFGGGTGGNGNWNTTSLFWTNSTAMQAWTNATNDVASFGGTAGTVTLTEAVTAGGLTFSVDGYTLAGNGNTLTLGGNVIVTNAGTQALIQSNLSMAAGLSFSGSGTLTFDTAYS
ncbi:MAG: hypothetical protein WAW39_28550, partial [Prosthecobacter sp.]